MILNPGLDIVVQVANLRANRLIGDDRLYESDCEWKGAKTPAGVKEIGIVLIPKWVKEGGNMYVAFAPDSPYMRGSIEMLAENQTPAGYVNARPDPESHGPITTEVYGPFGSDEFAAWFVPVLADHYLYTGDKELRAISRARSSRRS